MIRNELKMQITALNAHRADETFTTEVTRLTVLQAHPQLLVIFFLHVVDDLALVL